MASSRLYKIGSIFSRIDGLIRTGAIKSRDRPVWYDIYKAFPPKYEPTYAQEITGRKIKQILYQEDVIRAKLHEGVLSKSIFNLNETKNIWPIYQEYIDRRKKGQSKEEACAHALSNAENILHLKNTKQKVSDGEVATETKATLTETKESLIETEETLTETKQTPQANDS